MALVLLFCFTVISTYTFFGQVDLFFSNDAKINFLAMTLLQGFCGLASIPLIYFFWHQYQELRSARRGLQILFASVLFCLQISIIASAIIYFDTRFRNISEYEVYEDFNSRSHDGVLYLDGIIGKHAFGTVNSAFDRGDFKILDLRSPGGLIDVSIDLASLIRRQSIAVHVSGNCESACVIVATASPHLTADPSVVFGFHRAAPIYMSGDSLSRYSSEQATNVMLAALAENGIPAQVLNKARSTPPDEMYYLSAMEMYALGLVETVRR